jgi:hypothetical protein
MTPIIPNPKEPWKVCEKQLEDLDKWIKVNYPQGKLDTGVKYARWAVFQGNFQPADEYLIERGYVPDYQFHGKVFGTEITIWMWLPFFN